MDCGKIRGMFMDRIGGSLAKADASIVDEHLKGCEGCREAFARYKRSWDLLEEFEGIEPSPGYVSRFWTELSTRQTWRDRVCSTIAGALRTRRAVYRFALVAATVILLHVSFTSYANVQKTRALLLSVNEEEMELLEDLDLIYNLDMLEQANGFYNNGQQG